MMGTPYNSTMSASINSYTGTTSSSRKRRRSPSSDEFSSLRFGTHGPGERSIVGSPKRLIAWWHHKNDSSGLCSYVRVESASASEVAFEEVDARSGYDDDDQHNSQLPSTLPLTSRNIALVTGLAPMNDDAPSTTSGATSRSQSRSTTRVSQKDLEWICKDHRIYFTRRQPQPEHLANLVKKIIEDERSGAITPDSEYCAEFYADPRKKQKTENGQFLSVISNLFFYTGNEWHRRIEKEAVQFQISGEAGLSYDKSSVPTVPEAEKLPSAPRPDMTYGYMEEVFTQQQQETLGRLVHRHKPPNQTYIHRQYSHLLPFLIVDWKGLQGNTKYGNNQALRDGAAVVNTTYNFMKALGALDPLPENTVVFSVVVSSNNASMYVNWRNSDNATGPTYEMDHIYSANLLYKDQVFKLRSAILNIATWAKETRLTRIKHLLDEYAQRNLH